MDAPSTLRRSHPYLNDRVYSVLVGRVARTACHKAPMVQVALSPVGWVSEA